MTPEVKANVTAAQAEFLHWFREEEGELGKGKYEELAEKVTKATEGLLTQEMTLHCHWFRYGFPLYYGEKEGVNGYIPINKSEGIVMNWHLNRDSKNRWALLDSETNTYYIPKVTLHKIDPPSGSMRTEQYIREHLIEPATEKRKKNLLPILKKRKKNLLPILKGLSPTYATQIRKLCSDQEYQQLKGYIPELPE